MGLAVLRHVGSSQTRIKLTSPVLADRSLLLNHQGSPSYRSFTYFVRFISKYLILGGCSCKWYYIFNFNFYLFIACICYSVAQPCPTLYKPIDCGTPGFPVLHHFPELAQIHVHWVDDVFQPSHPVIPFSCLQSFPASGSFLMSWLFTSGGQNFGASALASVLPMNIQD